MIITKNQLGTINGVVAYCSKELMGYDSILKANSACANRFNELFKETGTTVDIVAYKNRERGVLIRFPGAGGLQIEVPLGAVVKEAPTGDGGPTGPSGGTPGAGVVEKFAIAA